jgi:predicted PurR-regulated permease PerM
MASASPRARVTKIADREVPKLTVGQLVELLLPLLLLALLIFLCVQLLVPFVGLLLWTIVLAICFYPVHNKLKKRMSNRLSAMLIGVGLSAVVLVPTAIAAISAASSVPEIVGAIQSGEREVRPPPAVLNDIPLVGKKGYALWQQASTDMPTFAKEHAPQLAAFTKWLVNQAGGLFVAILIIVAAIIFAAITLAYAERARAFILSILAKVTGSKGNGEHYMEVIGATVRSVANGVIGVAFVQALLVGIGFFVAGVPGAGILSIIAMVMGVLQLPVLLVTLPAIAWAFSVKTTTIAIVFTVWSLVSGLSDAALKPLLIGHGLEVPMPVILLGVIGGVMAYGLIGLFFGAVLLAVGYVLMMEWLGSPAKGKA